MNSKDLGADYLFAWPQAEISTGYIDELISPGHTRSRVCGALRSVGVGA